MPPRNQPARRNQQGVEYRSQSQWRERIARLVRNPPEELRIASPRNRKAIAMRLLNVGSWSFNNALKGRGVRNDEVRRFFGMRPYRPNPKVGDALRRQHSQEGGRLGREPVNTPFLCREGEEPATENTTTTELRKRIQTGRILDYISEVSLEEAQEIHQQVEEIVGRRLDQEIERLNRLRQRLSND